MAHKNKKVLIYTWFCMVKYTILRCPLNFVWGNLWSFKSLLVAPATLGLLAPMSATANEVTINDFNL